MPGRFLADKANSSVRVDCCDVPTEEKPAVDCRLNSEASKMGSFILGSSYSCVEQIITLSDALVMVLLFCCPLATCHRDVVAFDVNEEM